MTVKSYAALLRLVLDHVAKVDVAAHMSVREAVCSRKICYWLCARPLTDMPVICGRARLYFQSHSGCSLFGQSPQR